MTERRRDEISLMDMTQLQEANRILNHQIKRVAIPSPEFKGLREESEYIGQRMAILKKAALRQLVTETDKAKA